MSPQGLRNFLARWWVVLLLGTAVAGVAGFVVVAQVPPVYQANATLLVNKGSVSATAADDAAGAEALARTYAEALKTRPVLEAAAQRLGLAANPRDLQQAITVRSVTGTQLLHLTAEDRDPTRAADLANAVVAVFSEQNLALQADRFATSRQNLEQLVASLRGEIDSRGAELQQLRATLPGTDLRLARAETEFAQVQAAYTDSVRSLEDLRVSEARGLNSLTLVEPAVAVADPVRPNRPQSVALALLAGLVVTALIAKIVDYRDDRLPNGERLRASTGLRVLGSIPSYNVVDGGVLAGLGAPGPSERNARRAAESYRLLFSTLMIGSAEADGQPRSILLTSAATDEGKSLTAANLAAVLAEAGKRVILVDADLHRPSHMQRFQLPNRAGFSTLLLNPDISVDSLLRDTRLQGLRVLTAGPQAAVPSALYTSQRLSSRLTELLERCDVLVMDTPPVLAQPDAALLGPHLDGVLFVVDAVKSRGRQVRRALDVLSGAGAQILGAALNRVPIQAMEYVEYADEHQRGRRAEESPSSGEPAGAPAAGRAT